MLSICVITSKCRRLNGTMVSHYLIILMKGYVHRKYINFMPDVSSRASPIVRHSSVVESSTSWCAFAYKNPFEFCKSVRIFIVFSKQLFLLCFTTKRENETDI
jgi:hypothetical protein